jgi:hypothetical protein
MVGGRLARATISDDLVGDLLAFVKAMKTSALNRADVDEHVGSTGIGLDESEALLGVEPLHGSGLHRTFLGVE